MCPFWLKILSHKLHDLGENKLLNINFFLLPLQFLSETFVILRRSECDIAIHVHRYSSLTNKCLIIYLKNTLKFILKCRYYVFRSSTIIRVLALNPPKVIFTLKLSVKLRRYLLCGCVAASHGISAFAY